MEPASTLQQRVKDRVEALGASPITLAKSVGLERGYINDIVIGKKKSVRGANLDLLARALECDVDFLIGQQDAPSLQSSKNAVPLVGVCELGVWRSGPANNSAEKLPRFVPIEPDRRFPNLRNVAYEVRGNGLAEEGIIDGMIAIAIEREAFEAVYGPIAVGSNVVVRATMQRSPFAVETSLRHVVDGPDGKRFLVARVGTGTGEFDYVTMDDEEGVEIVAVVISAVRLFGNFA